MSLSIFLPEREFDFSSEVSELSKYEGSSRESPLIVLMIQIVHRHYLVDYHLGTSCSVLQRIGLDCVQKDQPKYRFSLPSNLLFDYSMNDDQKKL